MTTGARLSRNRVLVFAMLLTLGGCGDASPESEENGSTIPPAPTTTETTSPPTTAIETAETAPPNTTTTAAATTTTTAAPGPGDAEVGCMSFEVQRGPAGSLAEVTPCNLTASPKAPLRVGEVVSVDAVGQAVVDVDGCGLIYVFMGGSIQRSGCSRDGQDSGNTFCALSGTSQMQNDCLGVLQIETPSAVVLADGTVFSVSYDPETQVTLVSAFEDSVTVFPLVELNGSMGQGEIIEEGSFYFTAPDEQLALAVEVIQLEPRATTSIATLPLAATRLQLASEYNAIAWQLASSDIPAMSPAAIPVVNVRAAGGPFSNPNLRSGVSFGVNWLAQTAAFAEQGIAVSLLFEGDDVASAGAQFHDPAVGQAILQAFVDEGIEITILVAGIDSDAVLLAEGIAEELDAFGLRMEVVVYDTVSVLEGAPYADFLERVDAELPTLWISSTGLVLGE